VAAGFAVEQFTAHFPRSASEPTKRQQGVKDPKVIALSHHRGWLILTADKNMRIAHVEDFKKHPNATVLAITHHDGDDEIWVKAIITAKIQIERQFKKQARPWYAQVNKEGQVTTCKTIDCQPKAKKKSKGK